MTGTLKVVDGAVGSPAVQFSGAPSTGWYKTTNGIGIAVDGTKVAEFTASGLLTGARWIGELVPFTGVSAAPALTVFPYGQTLSRTTYAALWAFAQTEIAAGNTFYNNGNGSTTFGIGDMRGVVLAALDNMGGTAAGRLTSTFFGANPTILGTRGGLESNTLTPTQMPSHFHAANIFDPGHSHTYTRRGGVLHQDGTNALTVAIQDISDTTSVATTGVRVNSSNGLDTTYSAGGNGAHANVQPTMVCNYVLFAGGPI
ncbi:tail fiber protein [Bradyrhizobium sp. CCBAU 21362]|uniref:tail fiber protein n=1 Tax=Bradyrhizobium sp. CCBAU 21362 TaxID=1325082 RepID=UPI002306D7BF|nr:tail fiber protein [Bradyrhizobium sp. CCBAU 21362]